MSDDIQPPADLDALLDGVHDELTFGSFLHALAADFDADRAQLEADPERYRYSAGPLGWEVGTISDLLYGAAAEAGRRAPLLPLLLRTLGSVALRCCMLPRSWNRPQVDYSQQMDLTKIVQRGDS